MGVAGAEQDGTRSGDALRFGDVRSAGTKNATLD